MLLCKGGIPTAIRKGVRYPEVKKLYLSIASSFACFGDCWLAKCIGIFGNLCDVLTPPILPYLMIPAWRRYIPSRPISITLLQHHNLTTCSTLTQWTNTRKMTTFSSHHRILQILPLLPLPLPPHHLTCPPYPLTSTT